MSLKGFHKFHSVYSCSKIVCSVGTHLGHTHPTHYQIIKREYPWTLAALANCLGMPAKALADIFVENGNEVEKMTYQ